MININELIVNKANGTDGPWEWEEDSYGWATALNPQVIDTNECEPLFISNADKNRIARLPDLEAAYIEAVELLEKWSTNPYMGPSLETKSFLRKAR